MLTDAELTEIGSMVLDAGCCDDLPVGQVLNLVAEIRRLRSVLARVRDECGQVCPEFETCNHPACASSHAVWSIAAEVLEGGTPAEARRESEAERNSRLQAHGITLARPWVADGPVRLADRYGGGPDDAA